MQEEQNTENKAKAIIRKHGGMIRTRDALRAGIHQRTLYAMRDRGELERLARGLYRLTDAEPLGNPDLMTVAHKLPDAVICLVSALSFHDLTTQIPREVHLAVARQSRPPRLDYPPIKVYRFSGEAFSEGIETHDQESATIKVYGPEKTLADCFKYRNRIGKDIVLEAVRFYRDRKKHNMDAIFRFARICRVENVMRPYLEAIL